ncbi:hypothetical protein BD310DRAFT_936587 [Dichomitus squalens]|uniref:Uncharacterized protein n=1 Tax=Dichomitus squalens TaxID=114155 RepID=A0A4Q9PJ83_9APHY|nr:hypothetical protein BD310DRAFT_936587 [Dichomitus squalens]
MASCPNTLRCEYHSTFPPPTQFCLPPSTPFPLAHRIRVVASSFSHPHPLPCLAEANFPSFLVIVVLTGCTSTRALRLCVVEDVRGGGRQFECGQGGRVQCVV